NTDAGAVYLASGYLLYARQGALFAQRFDPTRLEVSGSPIPIAQQIAGGANMVALSASMAGPIAYRTGAAGGKRQLAWFDRTGKQIRKVGESDFLLDPSLSRDGRYIAVRRLVDTNNSVWLLDSEAGLFKSFTSSRSNGSGFPMWSPDGSRIIFSSS